MKPIERYRSFNINMDTFFERFMEDAESRHTNKEQTLMTTSTTSNTPTTTTINNEPSLTVNNANTPIQHGFDEVGNIETYTKTNECEDILLQACQDYTDLGYSKDDLINFINENL